MMICVLVSDVNEENDCHIALYERDISEVTTHVEVSLFSSLSLFLPLFSPCLFLKSFPLFPKQLKIYFLFCCVVGAFKHPRCVRGTSTLSSPQSVSSQHIPVRYGQAGTGTSITSAIFLLRIPEFVTSRIDEFRHVEG